MVGGLWRLPEGTGDVGSANALLALGRAVRVLEDECECEEAGGRSGATDKSSACGADTGGGEGEFDSSSGLAIRNPPSVCEREMSPFMAMATAAGAPQCTEASDDCE